MTLDLQTVLASEREIMNGYAEVHDIFPLFHSLPYSELRRELIAAILARLRADGRDPRALAFLDAGCGTGHTLALLAEAGCRRLTGVDIAEKMLAEAAERAPAARLIQGSIETHDFGAETFDVLIAGFTLHHMRSPRAFFELADRVLRPGGFLFVAEYNGDGWANHGWTRYAIKALAIPLRKLLKWKNRRRLAAGAGIPVRFNPAHTMLSYDQIVAAMPHPEWYVLERQTHGVFILTFNYSLLIGSAFDRRVYRLIRGLDRLAEPFDRGDVQLITGRRKA